MKENGKENRKNNWALTVAAKYLFFTLFIALFGAVYEYFSFGVYSYFMIYAFLWPLVLGTLPFLLMGIREAGICEAAVRPRRFRFWHAGVIILTTGSIFDGILAIYGTGSPLTKGYFIVGFGMLLVTLVLRKRN